MQCQQHEGDQPHNFVQNGPSELKLENTERIFCYSWIFHVELTKWGMSHYSSDQLPELERVPSPTVFENRLRQFVWITFQENT